MNPCLVHPIIHYNNSIITHRIETLKCHELPLGVFVRTCNRLLRDALLQCHVSILRRHSLDGLRLSGNRASILVDITARYGLLCTLPVASLEKVECSKYNGQGALYCRTAISIDSCTGSHRVCPLWCDILEVVGVDYRIILQ